MTRAAVSISWPDLTPTLGSVSLLAPWWAWALIGAVGVPIAAHLLSRHGGRLLDFPATRFVQQAVSDTAKLLRPRHWLLLVLRIAALALLVIAFMQPVWLSATPGADDQRGLIVTLLVDASVSMTRAEGGAALFDEARRRAIAALEQLDPSRDLASVILVDADPQPLLPEPSANFSALRARLLSAKPTHERGDAAGALALARAMGDRADDADDATRPRRAVWWTDAQATGWPGEALSAARAAGVDVRVHRIDGPTANIALRRPRVEPTNPAVGRRALASVEAVNHGEQPRTVAVRFDRADEARRVRLDAGQAARLTWPTTFDAPGRAMVRFALEGADAAADALALDDQVGRVVRVVEALPATLITRADHDDPSTAAFYLARALSPGADDDGGSGVTLRVLDPGQVAGIADGRDQSAAESELSERPGVWFLVETGVPDDALRVAVRDHLAAGGGVVWVVDTPTAADAIAGLDESLAVIEADGDQPWRRGASELAAARFDDPLLAVFEGSARAGLLGHRVAASVNGQLSAAAEPLMMFADGRPAAATRWVGPGRIAMVGFPLSPGASDLPQSAGYVALIQQLAHHLTPGRPPTPNPRPGEALGEPFTPGTIAQRVGPVSPSELSDEGDGAGDADAAAWVELDPAESDLRPIEQEAERDDASEGDADSMATGTDDAAMRVERSALWPWFALASLVLLLIEGLALWRWAAPVRVGAGRGVAHG